MLVNFYSNVVLYRNETNDKNWLRIKPVGTKSNPDGIGAQVRVFAGQKLVGFRHIQSGEGYCRSSALEAHVGLGKTPVENYRVEVFFPATNTRVVRENVTPGLGANTSLSSTARRLTTNGVRTCTGAAVAAGVTRTWAGMRISTGRAPGAIVGTVGGGRGLALTTGSPGVGSS